MEIKNVEFSNTVSGRNGSKSVYMSINNNDIKYKIKGRTPFGLQTYNFSKYCDVQLDNDDDINFFRELDNMILSKATENSFRWFNKSIHKTVINELYKPQMKQNKNYPPLLKIKFNKKYEITSDDIPKGSTCEFEIINTGIYFLPQMFGTSWQITDFKILEKSVSQTKLSGYAFIDE